MLRSTTFLSGNLCLTIVVRYFVFVGSEGLFVFGLDLENMVTIMENQLCSFQND